MSAAVLFDTDQQRLRAEASPEDRQAVVERAYARWEMHFSPAAGRERVASLVARLGVLT